MTTDAKPDPIDPITHADAVALLARFERRLVDAVNAALREEHAQLVDLARQVNERLASLKPPVPKYGRPYIPRSKRGFW